MTHYSFAEREVEQFNRLRYDHPNPHVRKKSMVMSLKALRYSDDETGRIAGVSVATVRRYVRQFREGGIPRLEQFKAGGSVSALDQYSLALKEEFARQPPGTAKEARQRIEAITGLSLGLTAVRRWLKKSGFSYRQVGPIPAKADPEVQAVFLHDQLEPLLQEVQQEKRHVFFVDAAHFVMGAFLGYLWCLTRILVPTGSGRQRFNVLGALHAVTHQLVTVTNDSYINSTSVVALLQRLAQDFGNLPITVVLDNARYQRNALVQAVAKELSIQLLFLPPYSPNLNLIERVWKFVKADCLNCRYHPTFADFRQAIENSLANISNTNERLDTLLTLKFHLWTTSPTATQADSPAQPTAA